MSKPNPKRRPPTERQQQYAESLCSQSLGAMGFPGMAGLPGLSPFETHDKIVALTKRIEILEMVSRELISMLRHLSLDPSHGLCQHEEHNQDGNCIACGENQNLHFVAKSIHGCWDQELGMFIKSGDGQSS